MNKLFDSTWEWSAGVKWCLRKDKPMLALMPYTYHLLWDILTDYQFRIPHAHQTNGFLRTKNLMHSFWAPLYAQPAHMRCHLTVVANREWRVSQVLQTPAHKESSWHSVRFHFEREPHREQILREGTSLIMHLMSFTELAMCVLLVTSELTPRSLCSGF